MDDFGNALHDLAIMQTFAAFQQWEVSIATYGGCDCEFTLTYNQDI